MSRWVCFSSGPFVKWIVEHCDQHSSWVSFLDQLSTKTASVYIHDDFFVFFWQSTAQYTRVPVAMKEANKTGNGVVGQEWRSSSFRGCGIWGFQQSPSEQLGGKNKQKKNSFDPSLWSWGTKWCHLKQNNQRSNGDSVVAKQHLQLCAWKKKLVQNSQASLYSRLSKQYNKSLFLFVCVCFFFFGGGRGFFLLTGSTFLVPVGHVCVNKR